MAFFSYRLDARFQKWSIIREDSLESLCWVKWWEMKIARKISSLLSRKACVWIHIWNCYSRIVSTRRECHVFFEKERKYLKTIWYWKTTNCQEISFSLWKFHPHCMKKKTVRFEQIPTLIFQKWKSVQKLKKTKVLEAECCCYSMKRTPNLSLICRFLTLAPFSPIWTHKDVKRKMSY